MKKKLLFVASIIFAQVFVQAQAAGLAPAEEPAASALQRQARDIVQRYKSGAFALRLCYKPEEHYAQKICAHCLSQEVQANLVIEIIQQFFPLTFPAPDLPPVPDIGDIFIGGSHAMLNMMSLPGHDEVIFLLAFSSKKIFFLNKSPSLQVVLNALLTLKQDQPA
jgi:hypothetical protein